MQNDTSALDHVLCSKHFDTAIDPTIEGSSTDRTVGQDNVIHLCVIINDDGDSK